MKKMPCLFQRIFHDRGRFTLTEDVTPGCEWVLSGEGLATRKWDGTACMVRDGTLFKRYDAKKDRKTGAYKEPPPGAIQCDDPDQVTWLILRWYKHKDRVLAQRIRDVANDFDPHPSEPFSQTRADQYEEKSRDRLGYHPGHDDECAVRASTPFGISRCGCGPKT